MAVLIYERKHNKNEVKSNLKLALKARNKKQCISKVFLMQIYRSSKYYNLGLRPTIDMISHNLGTKCLYENIIQFIYTYFSVLSHHLFIAIFFQTQ